MPEIGDRGVPLGGERVDGGERRKVTSPFDGGVLGTVPALGPGHVDAAVAAATRAMDDPLPPHRRADILEAAAVALREQEDAFARIIALEAAKPMKTARTEAQRAVLTLQFAAIEARTLTGEMIPMEGAPPGDGKIGLTLRVPIGVVGAITPFNFPLNLVCHKVAPAIAAGCAVVLKPASQTPFSSIALADLLIEECGLPPGWLNVVTGSGSDVGDPLVDHSGIALITFTGSPDVGWAIRGRAPRKTVNLELGNNAPLIIEPSGDWETAADKVKVAGYSHAGQSCISTQRVLVHRSRAERFTEALVERVGSLKLGDPLDEGTDVSALISPAETERVEAWVAEATTAGAGLAAGGGRSGRLLEPTVLTGVDDDMRVMADEVFGPVVSVTPYDDLGEALRRANDTRYGLQAAIFTAELASALRAARELSFGTVLVNEVPTFRSDQMPYGGVRDSGNTKEGPAHAVREMTVERLVVLDT